LPAAADDTRAPKRLRVGKAVGMKRENGWTSRIGRNGWWSRIGRNGWCGGIGLVGRGNTGVSNMRIQLLSVSAI
jgi:hypothetical protein